MKADSTGQPVDERRRPGAGMRLPFNVVLVLPAQITVMAVVLVPTLILIWLAINVFPPRLALTLFGRAQNT